MTTATISVLFFLTGSLLDERKVQCATASSRQLAEAQDRAASDSMLSDRIAWFWGNR